MTGLGSYCCVAITALLMLLPTSSTLAAADPPPVVPLTACGSSICIKIILDPPLAVDRIDTEHRIAERSSLWRVHLTSGAVIGIVSKPAKSFDGALNRSDGSFVWSIKSDRLAVANACLSCVDDLLWSPQWIGIAVQSTTPDDLMALLTTAGIYVVPLELYGKSVDGSPVLSLGKEENVFRNARRYGKWIGEDNSGSD